MKFFAIFGWPLKVTFSPKFQNAGLKAAKIDAAYMPIPVAPENFGKLWRALSRQPNFSGANVTIPHKQAAYRAAQRLTPEAKAVGAVNTLYRQKGRWVGHNTDRDGFVRALPLGLRGREVLILGAGGTARAVAAACLNEGAAHFTVACRRSGQGRALLKALGAKKASVLELGRVATALAKAEILVNTVPGDAFAAQLGARLPQAKTLKLVFDVGYASSANPLLAAARKRGLMASDGLAMLFEQGCLSFERFTGRSAPRRAMAEALGLKRH